MTEKKWALRRSPTVPQEVHVEPQTGNLFAVVDGYLRHWNAKGIPLNFAALDDTLFLTALQTVPKKALRCWTRRNPMEDTPWVSDFDPSSPTNQGWREMIERAPGDKLAEAVRREVSHEDVYADWQSLEQALREYDEATK